MNTFFSRSLRNGLRSDHPVPMSSTTTKNVIPAPTEPQLMLPRHTHADDRPLSRSPPFLHRSLSRPALLSPLPYLPPSLPPCENYPLSLPRDAPRAHQAYTVTHP